MLKPSGKEEQMNGPIRVSWTPAPSASDSIPFEGSRLTRAQRWLSLAEFIAGSAIVIGHNVYHVIPNEVPILFVIGLISCKYVLEKGGLDAPVFGSFLRPECRKLFGYRPSLDVRYPRLTFESLHQHVRQS